MMSVMNAGTYQNMLERIKYRTQRPVLANFVIPPEVAVRYEIPEAVKK